MRSSTGSGRDGQRRSTARRRWRRCSARLGVAPRTRSPATDSKAALRANTDAALAAGVYGVPTLAFDGAVVLGQRRARVRACCAARPGGAGRSADAARVRAAGGSPTRLTPARVRLEFARAARRVAQHRTVRHASRRESGTCASGSWWTRHATCRRISASATTITILPITVRIGDAVLADHRNEQATLEFLHTHVAERGAEAETTPFTVQQIQRPVPEKLVIDYDYVFCMTITSTRSPIYDNAHAGQLRDPQRLQAGARGRRPQHAVRAARDRHARTCSPRRASSRWKPCACATPAKARRRSARGWKTWRCTPRATWSRATCTTCATARAPRATAASACSAPRWARALDIKPVLHCNRGETAPVAKVKGFDTAAQKLFEFTGKRVEPRA